MPNWSLMIYMPLGIDDKDSNSETGDTMLLESRLLCDTRI